jgi:protein TonB
MAPGAHPFRIGGPAAASLLVNALLIAALLNLGMGRASRRTDAPSLTVMSLAVLKGAEDGEEEAEAAAPGAPTVAASSPAEPLPDRFQPLVVQPVMPPPVVPVPSALSRPMPATAMVIAVPGPATARPAASTRQAMPVATPAAPPARRGVADGLDADAPPGTSRSYAAKVRSWLYAHKIYPRRARMRREEGMVRVRFVIDRAGTLIEGVILQGSGKDALDEEAAAMMRRASPFPRAPIDVPGERIEFIAPIEFILPA